MVHSKIVAYQVQDDGNWDPVSFSKKKLKAKEVFILVDDVKKDLWIWIGQNADVRTRFISSTVAASIRRMYGLTLRVRSADQGEEPDDFWNCIDNIPPEGLGPEKLESGVIELSSEKSILNISSKLETLKKKQAKKIAKRPGAKRKKSSKHTVKESSKQFEKGPKTLNNYIKSESSLITTPPCPKCQEGNLLPYSQVLNVTNKRKEVIQFSKWICSNCSFSPDGIKKD